MDKSLQAGYGALLYSPGLSWVALLKKTGVDFELLTDQDIHIFIERGMRGNISMVNKRYAKANNTRFEGYLDANNLYHVYDWAMSRPLPKSGFKWKRVMPTKEH